MGDSAAEQIAVYLVFSLLGMIFVVGVAGYCLGWSDPTAPIETPKDSVSWMECLGFNSALSEQDSERIRKNAENDAEKARKLHEMRALRPGYAKSPSFVTGMNRAETKAVNGDGDSNSSGSTARNRGGLGRSGSPASSQVPESELDLKLDLQSISLDDDSSSSSSSSAAAAAATAAATAEDNGQSGRRKQRGASRGGSRRSSRNSSPRDATGDSLDRPPASRKSSKMKGVEEGYAEAKGKN